MSFKDNQASHQALTVGPLDVSLPERWDIGPILRHEIVGMPLLDQFADTYRGALDGICVLYINHAISDSLMVARALCQLGARLTSVLVPYHGAASPTQQAIEEAFAALGPSWSPSPSHPLQFAEAMRAAVAAAIAETAGTAARNGQRWMIVEDGGYAFPALHDDPHLAIYLENCVGAVEHTTRGRWNYEFVETDAIPHIARNLKRPAVTISGSQLKTKHEAGFVAQALLDECHWLLRRDHQFLRHRTVAVVGYGRVGKALARAVSHVDATVLVVDPAVGEIGFGMRSVSLVEAIAAGAFLIFGATGTSSLTREALIAFLFESPSEMLYLASASSKALEYAEAIRLLEQAAAEPELSVFTADDPIEVEVERDEIGIRYKFKLAGGRSKQVVLLGNGYPVIFFPPDTHGAPNRAMDPVMTQLFLAAAGLPAGAGGLGSRVHGVDEVRALPADKLPGPWKALVDEEMLLATWCQLNGIDWPTYNNQIGFV